MMCICNRFVFGLILLLGWSVSSIPAAHAQSYLQTNRSFVQAPQALGMGGAGVAFASEQTVFFYNPAHLAHVAPLRPHLTILGVRGSFSSNLFDQINFYRNELNPAIEDGLENLTTDELRTLYDETLNRGRTRTFLNGDVLLPSVMLRAGNVGIGGGLFAHSLVQYTFEDAGAGIPAVDLTGRADVMGLATAAVDLENFGAPGISAGVSVKYTQRYLTLKDKTVDTVRPDESLYLFKANSVGMDLGLLYDMDFVPLPGTLTFGVALYDLLASDFDYTFESNLSSDGAEDDPAAIAMEQELAQERSQLSRSSRIGFAYTVPELGGIVKETGIALDYVGYADPHVEQAFLTHFRMGVQVYLARILAVRFGLSQGYTTFGAGLDLGAFRIDYAYYGIEEGRLPGQLPNWNHTLQMVVGIF